MLFSLFLIIDLYLLIPAIIEQTFNPTAEFAIPNEKKVEIETHPVMLETK